MQKLLKRIADFVLSLLALIILSPIMIIATIGIKLANKGPIFYMAKRMGKNMKPMLIYKFRTMRVGADKESSITGANDSRIFAWGEFLRKSKIDELPQLINILNGTMSIVGPRPEDIGIVENDYTDEQKKTLEVLPGLACPGSIFNYTHGDLYLDNNYTDDAYVKKILPVKLALDVYYLEHWSLWYDAKIIIRTIYAILHTMISTKRMGYPLEYRMVFKNKINNKR